MTTIESIDARSDAVSVAHARELLLEYGQFVLGAEGPARFCFGRLEEEANGLPESYDTLGGKLLLALVDGAPAGCVSYRAINSMPGGCEMKRLWVRSAFRGHGLGEQLTLEVLKRAWAAGFAAVYLDTFPETMRSAYRTYLRLGFVACDCYNGSRTEGVVYMRRSLERDIGPLSDG